MRSESALGVLFAPYGQIERDRCSAIVRRCPDMPAVRLNNRATQRQTDAMPLLLCREEGLEHTLDNLGRDAAPCIGHAELHLRADEHCLYGHATHRATVRFDRVERIHDEVHDDLFELNAVAHDRRQIRGENELNVDLAIEGR